MTTGEWERFDTNPGQRRETSGSRLGGVSVYLCGFCNREQQPATFVRELLIRGSQVRILAGAANDDVGRIKM